MPASRFRSFIDFLYHPARRPSVGGHFIERRRAALQTVLTVYLVCINLALFAVMGADKAAAKRKRRRVPEATLLAIAVLGGSIGGIAGMLLFHHKTHKAAFFLGLPLILLAQIALAYLIAA